jgi:transcription initiation factor TFIIIB Brf1 subunit/transcription initiation factor TFIIB
MSDFIDDDLFDRLAEMSVDTLRTKTKDLTKVAEDSNIQIDKTFNICPDCNISMPYMKENDEMVCTGCGFVKSGGGEAGVSKDASAGYIRMSSRNNPNSVRVFSINNDYSKTQKKTTLDLLVANCNRYDGRKIPKSILQATATLYNDIQKNVLTEEDKKFVKRGTIRHEVLAAILYYECIEFNVARRKKDIAAFMRLQTGGFSRGEKIVRALNSNGSINIQIDKEPASDFATRYLAILGIDPKYQEFVSEFIKTSEEYNIGMTSQSSSKVVGAIWILINGLGLAKTHAEVEAATDNCKRNTYLKYCRSVEAAPNIFEPVFEKHGVKINYGK